MHKKKKTIQSSNERNESEELKCILQVVLTNGVPPRSNGLRRLRLHRAPKAHGANMI
jgi:hypothetical protein